MSTISDLVNGPAVVLARQNSDSMILEDFDPSKPLADVYKKNVAASQQPVPAPLNRSVAPITLNQPGAQTSKAAKAQANPKENPLKNLKERINRRQSVSSSPTLKPPASDPVTSKPQGKKPSEIQIPSKRNHSVSQPRVEENLIVENMEEEGPFFLSKPQQNNLMLDRPAASSDPNRKNSPSSNTSKSGSSGSAKSGGKNSPSSKSTDIEISTSKSSDSSASPVSKAKSFVDLGDTHTEELGRVKSEVESVYRSEASKSGKHMETLLKTQLTLGKLILENNARVLEASKKPKPRSQVWDERAKMAFNTAGAASATSAALVGFPPASTGVMIGAAAVATGGLCAKAYAYKCKRDEKKARAAAKKQAQYKKDSVIQVAPKDHLKAEIAHKNSLSQIAAEMREISEDMDDDVALQQVAKNLVRMVTSVKLEDPEPEENTKFSTRAATLSRTSLQVTGPAVKICGPNPSAIIAASVCLGTAALAGGASVIASSMGK